MEYSGSPPAGTRVVPAELLRGAGQAVRSIAGVRAMATLPFQNPDHAPPAVAAISPWLEMGAYEHLWWAPRVEWGNGKATFKRIAELLATEDSPPSRHVARSAAVEMSRWVMQRVRHSRLRSFGVRIYRAGEYPSRLRDADYPVELLYYSGDWELASTPSVAIVGSRTPSEKGVLRARKLTSLLVESGWTAVSGLAAGIDEAVHNEALRKTGRTIAVIGTPLTDVYPTRNTELQARIARDHLLISQVPFRRYSEQDWRANRTFFPERNVTMSALTSATVIVEAGNTSGTLTQAKAALRQDRRLFILNSCFENPELTWPHEFEEQGAVRVHDFDQILAELPKVARL